MGLHCDVQYDTDQDVFQPGQMLSGRLIVTLQERLLFRALSLKISGYTLISWEKPSKKRKQPKYDKDQVEQVQVVTNQPPECVYSYREDYISMVNYYVGSEEATERIVERGIYTYPFAARLPERCPSTFETALGYVRYELQVCIDYRDRQDIFYSRTLPVHNPIDLRVDSSLMQPLELDFIEKKKCMKFWQKPLMLHINIPQGGYVPGENISVYAKITNLPQLSLKDIIYKLNMIGTYMGEYKKKTKIKQLRTNLAEKEHSLSMRKEASVQHLDLLLVPPTPPNTTASQCKCLQLEYEVEVIVTTSKRKRFVTARLPIRIGTISLRSELREMSTAGASLPAAYSVEHLGGVYIGPTPLSNSFSVSTSALTASPLPRIAPLPPLTEKQSLEEKPPLLYPELTKEMEAKSSAHKKAEAAGVKVLPSLPPPYADIDDCPSTSRGPNAGVELRTGSESVNEKHKIVYSDVESIVTSSYEPTKSGEL